MLQGIKHDNKLSLNNTYHNIRLYHDLEIYSFVGDAGRKTITKYRLSKCANSMRK